MSIILTTNEIEQIKQNKCIGKGSFANLYEYDDKVIKLFKGRLDGEEKRLIKALQKENIENFIFPEEIVRDFFRFMIGYTEEKINGITLRKLFTLLYRDKYNDITINDFVKKYEQIKPSICELSNKKIVMFDAHDENIMYNGYFNFVDTDLYYRDRISFASWIYNKNLNEAGRNIMDTMNILNRNLTSDIERNLKKNIYDPDYFERFIDVLDKNYSDVDTLIKYKNKQIK